MALFLVEKQPRLNVLYMFMTRTNVFTYNVSQVNIKLFFTLFVPNVIFLYLLKTENFGIKMLQFVERNRLVGFEPTATFLNNIS